MHVLFVNPPSPFLVNDRGAPPLGILHLAAECQDRGIETSMWDMTGDARLASAFARDANVQSDIRMYMLRMTIEAFAEQDNPVDLFAITATSAQYDTSVKLMRMIHTEHPRIPVAIGGSHVSTLPQMAIEDGFDWVVTGEADLDFPNWLAKWGIPKRHEKPLIMHCTAPSDLNALCVPDRRLVDLRSYCANLSVGEGFATTVHFSRGCPFSCNYCVRTLGDKARLLRVRSPELCLSELDHLHEEYGVSRFTATDDIFGIKRSWLEGFCDYFRGRDYHFRVNCRANTLHFDLLPAMKRAGVDVISFGFESGSEDVLKSISKNNVELNTRAVHACHEAGINVKAYLIYGFETDSVDSAAATKRWIAEAKPDSAQVAWLIPLPGTPIYQKAIMGGWLPDYQSLYHNGKDHHGGMSRLPWHMDDTVEIYEDLVSWIEMFYAAKQPEIECPVALSNN